MKEICVFNMRVIVWRTLRSVSMCLFYHGYWTLMYVALRVLPVCLQWTPEGRRLVTGASSGEFTLWNGLTFNFETILQVNMHLPSWLHHCDVSMAARTIWGFCFIFLHTSKYSWDMESVFLIRTGHQVVFSALSPLLWVCQAINSSGDYSPVFSGFV